MIRVCRTSILIFFTYLGVLAQTPNGFNLDFEELSTDQKMADGWYRASDYPVSIEPHGHNGTNSGHIISNNTGIEGRIAYVVPANYDGKDVLLEGYMKTEKVTNGFTGLFMRMEGSFEGYPGFVRGFNKMEDRNIHGTNDWTKYSVSMALSENVDYIIIGGILSGKGEAWFDDFRISIDGKDIGELPNNGKIVFGADLDKEFDLGSDIEFPTIDDKQIDNLELLGKIWGFLKYHHPEVAKGAYNWDYELLRMLPEYVAVVTPKERDSTLVDWINRYGELEKCITCKGTAQDAFLPPDNAWIKHGDMSDGLQRTLENIYRNRAQGKHFYIKMSERIRNPEFTNEAPYQMMPYPDKGFRLLALYKYWNAVHYFFPYRHLIKQDWNHVLKQYIPEFLDTESELEYELAAIHTGDRGDQRYPCQPLGRCEPDK